MRCPYCGNDDTQVKDSRPTDDSSAIRRRRICPSCGGRFTTFERVQLRELMVVKKSGRRVPFDRDRIKQGLAKACWKRPISDEQIEATVAAVELEIYANFDAEVPSREIGELVMKSLAGLDQVAYVRFASVYREFKDAQDFVEELQPMLGASRRQTFTRVIFPIITPALLTGFALAFARALGEYGSVIFIAGNMPMVSEITPLLIITKLEQYDYSGATAIAVVMLVTAFAMLLAINGLQAWTRARQGR